MGCNRITRGYSTVNKNEPNHVFSARGLVLYIIVTHHVTEIPPVEKPPTTALPLTCEHGHWWRHLCFWCPTSPRTETHLSTKEDTATPSSVASATSLASFVASEFAERQDETSRIVRPGPPISMGGWVISPGIPCSTGHKWSSS